MPLCLALIHQGLFEQAYGEAGCGFLRALLSDREGRSAPNGMNSGRLYKRLYKGPGACTWASVGESPLYILNSREFLKKFSQ